MKHIYLLLCIMVLSVATMAQAQQGKERPAAIASTTPSGRVLDALGRPLEGAMILVLDGAGEVLDGAVSQADGCFALKPLSPHAHTIGIRMLGYRPHQLPATGAPLGDIVLVEDATQLDEVIVHSSPGRRVLTSRSLTAQIEGSPLAQLPSLVEVLAQLPFVSASHEGIRVQGRGTPMLYYGHRPIDMDELRRIDPQSISRIEVVLVPGAEYPATASAVVRITPRSWLRQRLGGRVSLGLFQSERTGYITDGELTLATDKLFVQVGGAHSQTYNDYGQELRHTLETSQGELELTSLGKVLYRSRPIELTGQLIYKPHPKHEIGLQGRLLREDRLLTNEAAEDEVTRSATLLDKYTSTLVMQTDRYAYRHTANAYYQTLLGEHWTGHIEASYTHRHEPLRTTNTLDHTAPTARLQIVEATSSLRGHSLSLKAYGEGPLWDGKIRLGVEYSDSRVDQDYTLLRGTSLTPSSSIYRTERGVAAFGMWEGRLAQHLSLSLGLRAEQMPVRYWRSAGVRHDYGSRSWSLFPTAGLSYSHRELSLSLSYRSEIQRPLYSQLRNHAVYINDYSIESGNPTLRPTYSHALSLLASYGDWSLDLSARRIIDGILIIPRRYQGHLDIHLSAPANASYGQLAASLVWSHTYGIWTPTLTLGAMANDLELLGVRSARPLLTGSVQSTLSLPRGWLITASLEGNTRGYMAFAEMFPAWQADLAVVKTFGRSLSVSLTASDLFTTGKEEWLVRTAEASTYKLGNGDYPTIRLIATYRLRTRSTDYRGGTAGEAEASRL